MHSVNLRRHRRWLAAGLIGALLFMQLAVSAYACPYALQPGTAAAGSMPDCDGTAAAAMDPDQPLLCKAHCDQGTQVVKPAPSVDSVAQPVLLTVVHWLAALPPPQARPAQRRQVLSGAGPPGAPPLYLAFLVLRN